MGVSTTERPTPQRAEDSPALQRRDGPLSAPEFPAFGFYTYYQSEAREENMASSVNKVILVGRLGKDPELKYTQGGTPVAKFSIATDETWKDQSWREAATHGMA